MRVAVVVPCFNDGGFLEEALGSLEAQEPHELVVVDDGSTDPATLQILGALEADGVRVLHQANAGLGAARMAGLRATSAPLVHPLDADDLLTPGALALLADALEADGVDIAWGSFRMFGAIEAHCPTAADLDPWRITYLDEITGTCMVSRRALEAVGGWDDVAFEDWDLWMKLAEAGYAGIGLKAETLQYRQHETPSLLARSQTDHDRHWQTLEARHRDLIARRATTRRSSTSPRRMRLALSALDALPVRHARKAQLFAAARHVLQGDLSSEGFRGPLQRMRERLARPPATKVATRSASDSSER